MQKKRFSEEQIAFALRQEESGIAASQVRRKLGVSEATFYRWKKKFGSLGVPVRWTHKVKTESSGFRENLK